MAKQKNFITQQGVLKQRLTFQNIQLFKMMELNLLQFDQKVKEELDINPALENMDGYQSKEADIELDKLISTEESTIHSNQDGMRNEDFFSSSSKLETLHENSIYENHNNQDYNRDDEDRELYIPIEDNESLSSSLLNQLKYNITNDKQLIIGEFIIGNLDDDGYLRRSLNNIVDDLSFRQNISTTEDEVKQVLDIIQDLEPAGIAASNLQECLLLQLQRRKYSRITHLAMEVVSHLFEHYSKKHFDKIYKKLKISEEEFEIVNKEILSLNPKPSESNPSENLLGKYIIPDFLVYKEDNKLELELHSYNQPNLSISSEFVDMLKKLKAEQKKSKVEKDAQEYISDKINKANLFISLVKERQETMIIIMNTILNIQKKFFQTGDESDLTPMVLRNIAEKTNFDISTVSRVTNSKYVQTEFGVFPLKFFFSEGILNDEGEEISTRRIMKKLEEIVLNEDKENPLSDDQITVELKKSGFSIARRTTAKYRENLNIPPKHLRKSTPKA